jgi:hypothetical protein
VKHVTLSFDLEPRTPPESLLEDVWPYLQMTPEQRDLERQLVCRDAMNQWTALPETLRRRAEWAEDYLAREGMELLQRWAAEYRQTHGASEDR